MDKGPWFDIAEAWRLEKKVIKYQDIQPGDIALFTGVGFVFWMIRLITRGKVAHAGLISGYNEIIHAVKEGVVKRKLSEYLAQNTKNRCFIRRVKPAEFPQDENISENIDKVIEYAESKIGLPYDLLNIFGLSWRSLLRMFGLWRIARVKYILDNKRMRFICSELLVESYKHIGIDLTTIRNPYASLTTPNDLMKSSKLNPICDI